MGRGIGNCAEEIYYGLLKAKREGKGLFSSSPIICSGNLDSTTFINRELLRSNLIIAASFYGKI